MYQPETEDLIPRCAPKPSISSVNEEIVRPSVPEVSIVFSQSESLQSHSTPPSATTTYAAWKKQCLPQVIYPPTAEITDEEFSALKTRSNVYPMRSAAAVVPIINAASAQFASTRPNPSNTIRRNSNLAVQPHCHFQSPMAHCGPTYTLTAPCCKQNTDTNNKQRKSLDNTQHSMETNVLTICAGTQTDSFAVNRNSELDIDHLATKDDIAQVQAMLFGMRMEQNRLMEIVQHVLVLQGKTQNGEPLHKLKDVATQSDPQPLIGTLPQKRPHIRYDSIEEEDSPEEDSYHLQKKTNLVVESPPPILKFQQQYATNLPRSDVVSGLPKPATEQSMVMNELALKYLPNEKLSELLQELHVSPVPTSAQREKKVYETPLKHIENYGKSPSDLSRASYKYLKKYRLLPEENNNCLPTENVLKSKSPNKQENMLDLETIRRQPKFM